MKQDALWGPVRNEKTRRKISFWALNPEAHGKEGRHLRYSHGQPQCLKNVMLIGLPSSAAGTRSFSVDGARVPISGGGDDDPSTCDGESQDRSSVMYDIFRVLIW